MIKSNKHEAIRGYTKGEGKRLQRTPWENSSSKRIIVDAISNELAKITCIIKVQYQCGEGLFDQHAIPPMDFPLPGTPWIELEFISTHYDFVSDIVKAEKSTSSTLELNKRLSNRGEDH